MNPFSFLLLVPTCIMPFLSSLVLVTRSLLITVDNGDYKEARITRYIRGDLMIYFLYYMHRQGS